MLLIISAVSFILSFVFGLGGLGSAVALIPVLTMLGVPFDVARAAGLLVNFISTGSATLHNIKNNLVIFRKALPIVITSIFLSPVGAYASHELPERFVGIAFTLFLIFAGVSALTPKKKSTSKGVSTLYAGFVGAVAGFLSGLLGIGGGGVISPLLLIKGENPKEVSSITAFAVPFSSFVGFIAYWKLGSVNWSVTLSAAIPAIFAGYIAAHISSKHLEPEHVKKILGVIFFLLALKFLFKFL